MATVNLRDIPLFAWLDREPGAGELIQSLGRLWDTMEAVWKAPVLRWYTDHGPQHAFRVGQLASQVASLCPRQLNKTEAYVLIAACMVHDIGMQAEEHIGLAPERFTAADYDTLRDAHALASSAWVRANVTLFPDRTYADAIAVICEGHTTSGFTDAVAAGDSLAPANVRIRGDLLVCILLLADELDLHCSRATSPVPRHWSPLVRLHHFKHSFVDLCEVGGTPLAPLVLLSFPTRAPYRQRICEWIGSKLVQQMRRLEPILSAHGIPVGQPVLKWQTRTGISQMGGREEALLREMMARDAIGDYKETLRAIGAVVAGSAAVEVVAPSDALVDGLHAWVVAESATLERPHAEIVFTDAYGIAAAPAQVEQRIRAQLLKNTRGASRKLDLAALLRRKRPVLVLNRTSVCSLRTARWIDDTLVPAILASSGSVLSVTTRRSPCRVFAPQTCAPLPDSSEMQDWFEGKGYARSDYDRIATRISGLSGDGYATLLAACDIAGASDSGRIERR